MRRRIIIRDGKCIDKRLGGEKRTKVAPRLPVKGFKRGRQGWTVDCGALRFKYMNVADEVNSESKRRHEFEGA